MRDLPKTCWVTAPLLVLCALSCQASGDGGQSGPGAGGKGGAGGGGTLNLAGGVALPPGTQAASLLPARIRRLTVAEYQATVSSKDVIGAPADGISSDFVPDSRQSGFTVNDAQRVDPVFAGQLSAAATTLATALRADAANRAPCANPATDADKCADQFIRSFGQKAYRRPLGDDEVTQLMTVFHTALSGGSYEEGIELTARAMLQSAAFLYLTEIGDAPAATIKLTPSELASAVSYLVQGGPPSAELVDAANAGRLDTPEGRADVLADGKIDLYAGTATEARVDRVIGEWLGTDKISETAKDSNAYPDFLGLRADIEHETSAFLEELVGKGDGGSLNQLLAADWTVASAPLATLYGVSGGGSGHVSTPNRLGILNQSAFLSVFAHASESAPVLRGVAVMRRIACVDVGDPVALKISVVPPAPDPTKTTRQRFAAHAVSTCSSCHNSIDNFGFAFEGFDGMGKSRSMDNGSPVDSSVVIAGTDFDGSYPDSNALVKAMSTSSQVRECFARHVFRAFAATSDPLLRQSEDDFVKYWHDGLTTGGSPIADVKIINTISAFIENPSFAYRRAQ